MTGPYAPLSEPFVHQRASDEIDTAYKLYDGPNGPLGALVGPSGLSDTLPGHSGYYRSYANGIIIKTTEIYVVHGIIYSRWLESGRWDSPLGLPIDNPRKNPRMHQFFAGGRIYETADGQSAYSIYGDFLSAWASQGGGYPIGEAQDFDNPQRREQPLEDAVICGSDRSNPIMVQQEFVDKWHSIVDRIGVPVAAAYFAGCWIQEYEQGVLYAAGNGAYEVREQIFDMWQGVFGGPGGSMGGPTSDPTPDASGAAVQYFANGAISYLENSGIPVLGAAHVADDAVKLAWVSESDYDEYQWRHTNANSARGLTFYRPNQGPLINGTQWPQNVPESIPLEIAGLFNGDKQDHTFEGLGNNRKDTPFNHEYTFKLQGVKVYVLGKNRLSGWREVSINWN
jgi:hypothetical protein